MTLFEAMQWLSRDIAGFADLDAFAERCRCEAARGGREAAALVLLARAAAEFTERHEGMALPSGAMRAFLAGLHEQARRLGEAGTRGSDALLVALNDCAAYLADEAESGAAFRLLAQPST
jgi:hypothetical protein